MLKPRDYPWTVLLVDPIATRLIWLFPTAKPNLMTSISLLLAAFSAAHFLAGSFVIGAALYYLHFLFDCMDGKLARLQQTDSIRGKFFDRGVDLYARSSIAISLIIYYLLEDDVAGVASFALFGWAWLFTWGLRNNKMLLMQTWTSKFTIAWWDRFTLKFRLSRTPGFADLFGMVYVVGPLADVTIGMVQVMTVLTVVFGAAIFIDCAARDDPADSIIIP